MSTRMRCPMCRASMYKDDPECPECGWENEKEMSRQDQVRREMTKTKRDRGRAGPSGPYPDTKKR